MTNSQDLNIHLAMLELAVDAAAIEYERITREDDTATDKDMNDAKEFWDECKRVRDQITPQLTKMLQISLAVDGVAALILEGEVLTPQELLNRARDKNPNATWKGVQWALGHAVLAGGPIEHAGIGYKRR